MADVSATAHLVYGLLVQTADLLAAARAHPKLPGPTRALKLIQLRRAKATLRTKMGSRMGAVKRVPVEVWSMIQQALIDVEVRDSRLALLAEVACRDCQDIREYAAWRELIRGQEKEWDKYGLGKYIERAIGRLDASLYRVRVWHDDWIDCGELNSNDNCHDERHSFTGDWDGRCHISCISEASSVG